MGETPREGDAQANPAQSPVILSRSPCELRNASMPSSGPSGRSNPRAWIAGSPGAPAVEIWELSPAERLRRSLARAGCCEIRELAPGEAPGAAREGADLVVSADRIYDERLVEALASADADVVLVDPATGEAVAARVAAERAREIHEWIRARRAGAPP